MKTKRPLTPEQAQVRAEELCARADYSSGEIRDRLLRWGIYPGEADRIVADMTKKRFIDDERFARSFMCDKIRYSRWGKRKIALALYQKRVPRDIIDQTLGEFDDDTYREALVAVLAAKRRTLTDPDTYEGRTKLFRHAASRGFEPPLIAEILKQA